MAHDATHFVLGHYWRTHFEKKKNETGRPLSVENLREWIDEPKPMGLPREVQNMIILLFAEQTNHSLFRHNVAIDCTLKSLPDDCELRGVDLPPQADWDVAVSRAATIFAKAPSTLLKASNVNSLGETLHAESLKLKASVGFYSERLAGRLGSMGVSAESSDRLKTSVAAQSLVDSICNASAEQSISKLASAQVATSESAMGECLGKATQLAESLNSTNWEIFEAVSKLKDDRKAKADQIATAVKSALQSDEHVTALGAALQEAQSKAVRLLTVATSTSPLVVPPVTEALEVVAPTVKPGKKIVDEGSQSGLDIESAEKLIGSIKKKIKDNQTARINVSYVIEEGSSQ